MEKMFFGFVIFKISPFFFSHIILTFKKPNVAELIPIENLFSD